MVRGGNRRNLFQRSKPHWDEAASSANKLHPEPKFNPLWSSS